jgi:hypothetical protein
MLAISMYRVLEKKRLSRNLKVVHYSFQDVTAFLSVCMNVCERFMSVFAQKRSRNVGNLDVQERSEMVSNVGQSEVFMLYKMNGMTRLQNHVHGTFTFTFTLQKRKKHCTAILSFLKRERDFTNVSVR